MANQITATPECEVIIYPFFGGKYFLNGNNGRLLRVLTNKNIRNATGGHFRVVLAPGGPKGTDDPVTWTSVLVPNSLVIIRMGRGQYRETVMIGVVTGCAETQEWQTGRSAGRSILVEGQDFTRFLTNYSYYTLQAFGLLASNLLGGIGGIPGLQGISTGTPASVATQWYTKIMAGNQGILGSIKWNINGALVSFDQLVAYGFQDYSVSGENLIPVSLNFMNNSGSWFEKFTDLFPFPVYEFFVNTAPVSKYTTSVQVSLGGATSSAGQTVRGYYNFADYNGLSGIVTKGDNKYTPSVPTIIARVNPLPYSYYDNATSSWKWNNTAWNNLTTYSLDSYSFVNSTVKYDANEARNFYVYKPSFILSLLGMSNSNLVSAMDIFGSMIDGSSIDRFGYRPEIMETLWFSDPKGQAAIKNTQNGKTTETFINVNTDILSRIASYYEPTPNMLIGQVSFPLRPDIIPGNRFQYQPFKDGSNDWMFYIEGVTHNWEFGGQTLTTLDLARGLSVSDYTNTQLMIQLHTGTAQRIDGKLQKVNGLKGLVYNGPSQTISQQYLSALPGIYSSYGSS